MRLKTEQILKISELILHNLQEKKLIAPRVPKNKILESIAAIITGDLMAEVKIEDEARKLMDKYRTQIESGMLNERELLLKIKKQLAKEKKIVL
ncbi:MAG: DUF507 family protein [Deltaproteobacteria bacterium]|nr:DUF507 family protein [Deltaproteobacteria bacterium]